MGAMREPESRMVEANGIRIHYLDWGGDGQPVVCLHGISGNCHFWDGLARALPAQYHLYGLDLRGHGDSDKPETGYGFHDLAADLEGFLRQLGLQKPIAVGYSLGGRIAIYHLAHFPSLPERLVVIDSGIGMSIPQRPEGAGEHRRQGVPRRFASVDDYLATMKKMPLMRNWTADQERFVLFGAKVNPDGSVETKMSREGARQTTRAVLTCDLTEYFDRVRCPTLVIRATEGHLPPETAALMMERIPECQLVVLEDTNHNVPLDNPEGFEKAVIEFLEGRQTASKGPLCD